jgi:outer membrane protein assembly factor BamB
MPRPLRSTPTCAAVAATLIWLGSASLFAADARNAVTGDWPEWRGAGRASAAASFELPATWPKALRLVWEREVGPSDAGPVVAGGQVFTFTRAGDREVVTALDLDDGSVLWQEGYGAPFKPFEMVGLHGAGPYSTPLVAGGRLFTLGITQTLSARDAATGKLLWQRRFDSDYKVTQPFYGNSLSPLLVDDHLVIEVGGGGNGALLAVDPATGQDVWRLPGDGPAYGSPIAVEIDGTKQIVTLTQRRLIGADAETGKLLWETPFQVDADNTALTPVLHQGLLVLGATRRPLRAYRVARAGDSWTVEQAWSNPEVSPAFSTPVVAGGSLVAFAGQNKGQLVVVDPATGAVTWAAEGRQGDNAYLVAIGSTVLAFLVDGDLEVASIAAGQAKVAARYTVAQSTVWSHPVILDRHFLVKDQSHLRLWAIPAD